MRVSEQAICIGSVGYDVDPTEFSVDFESEIGEVLWTVDLGAIGATFEEFDGLDGYRTLRVASRSECQKKTKNSRDNIE